MRPARVVGTGSNPPRSFGTSKQARSGRVGVSPGPRRGGCDAFAPRHGGSPVGVTRMKTTTTTTTIARARPDWRDSEVWVKNRLLLHRTGRYISSLHTVSDFLGFVQTNRLWLYCVFLATLGVRLSLTVGMGWALIAACMLTTGLGYAKCIYQALVEEAAARDGEQQGSVGTVLLRAYQVAFAKYSFKAEEAVAGGNDQALLLSALYEPSPVYLLLNCWGLYAVGQCAVCGSYGGGLFLMVSLASFVAGRSLQFGLWKRLGQHRTLSSKTTDGASSAGPPSLVQQLSEMLFTPIGTWGIGPVFNGVVWFACLALPFVEYPASPVAMAPLWTALGVPILLLLEDIFSLCSKQRRNSKYATSMGPGLQIGSFVVGASCAFLIRSAYTMTFQLW